jgi:hypothetical protein
MVPAAPDVPAVQVDAVEQSAPSYPASHVQVQLPVVPPTVPWAASHGMVSAAPDVLAVHWHEMVLFGGAVLIEHLAGAEKNVSALATLPTFHSAMLWLNAVAPSNMSSISVTLAVFQSPMFWLNADAFWNMYFMEVTFDVVHVEMSWSKAVAPLNMLLIVVTLEVFHVPMG